MLTGDNPERHPEGTVQIAGIAQERSACTHIRIAHPIQKIRDLGLAGAYVIGPADPNQEKVMKAADVIIFGRAASEQIVQMVRGWQNRGKKVVFDLDDNMFEVSVMSPHYRQLGIMPVEITNTKEKEVLWGNGKDNFDAERNRRVRKSFIEVIRQADCVTTTTPRLVEVYSRFNDMVRLVPNAIDFSVWEKPPIRREKEGEVRLLYTGAANHQEDWMFIRPVLEELQKKYPQLTIVVIGTCWSFINNQLDYGRIEVVKWADIDAYPHVLKSLCCDIGIAPIAKHDFNLCRSNLKWVEYSALKCATVATDWGEYTVHIKDGETGMLASTQKEWTDKLSVLIENADLRKRMTSNAFNICKSNFNLEFTVDKWIDVFKEVKNGVHRQQAS